MEELAKIWYKKWWGKLILVALFIVVSLLIAALFYIIHKVNEIKNSDLDAATSARIENIRKRAEGDGNDYWLGSPEARIVIVEFGDFACPFCRQSSSKIRQLAIKYKNDVKIIFRDFPLHENSMDLAIAARCAGEQNLFWLMHDQLFKNQGVSSKADLVGLAREIGADTEKFSVCFDDKKYAAQIQKDFSDGQDLGVTGTPTWFINGYQTQGDMPEATWENIINRLKNASN